MLSLYPCCVCGHRRYGGAGMVLLGLVCLFLPRIAAAAADELREFNIKRQLLSAALLDFSYQSDVQVLMPGYLTEGIVSPKVKGEFTASQALEMLLRHSDLEYAFVAGGTVTIRRKPADPPKSTKRRRYYNDPDMEQLFVTADESPRVSRNAAVSMAALSGDDLESRGITRADELQQFVPGLTIGSSQIGNAEFNIRGVGASNNDLATQPGVGVYIDDIYIPRQGPANMALYELERVEVLRGPQATLYSRNATGGAMVYLTRETPEEFSGRYSLDYGNRSRLNNVATLGGGLTKDVSGLLAVASFGRDPLMENLHPAQPDGNEIDSLAARARLRIAVNHDVEWILGGDSEETRQAGVLYSLGPDDGYQFVPGMPVLPASDPAYSANVDVSANEYLNTHGWMSRVNVSADNYRASYILGRRAHELGGFYDLDQSPQPLVSEWLREASQLYSFEARFSSPSRARSAGAPGETDWVAGVYLLDEKASVDRIYFAPGLGADFNVWRQDAGIQTYSLFGQAEHWLSDRLRVIYGLRHIVEIKAFELGASTDAPGEANPYIQENFRFERRQGWRRLTPRLAVRFDYDPDISLYAGMSTGFKAGGYSGVAGTRVEAERELRPERVESLEMGIRSSLFANRVKTKLTLFVAEFSDFQVSGNDQYGKPLVVNARQTRFRGLELEVQARPAPSVVVGLGISVLGAQFERFALDGDDERQDKAGDRVPGAPDATLNLTVTYLFPETAYGSFSVRGDAVYSEEGVGLDASEEAWSDYRNYNLWFDFLPRRGNWELGFWVRNAADSEYFQASAAGLSSGNNAHARKLEPPRMYGLSFRQYW